MAHFYGTVQGNRGEATRLGHRILDVTAQSYEGDIVVCLSRSEEGNRVEIGVRDHQGGTQHPANRYQRLYCGLIKDLLDMEHRAAQMHLLGVQKFTEGLDKENDDA